jgi:hypothetical protein
MEAPPLSLKQLLAAAVLLAVTSSPFTTALLSPKGVNNEGPYLSLLLFPNRCLCGCFFSQTKNHVRVSVFLDWFRADFASVCPLPAVQALIGIKNLLKDPHGVLRNWDQDSVDPCSFAMVTCSPDNFVTGL